MASFQTNAIPVSGAAIVATKTSAPAQNNNADSAKFSDMLTGAHTNGAEPNEVRSRPVAKTGVKARHDADKKTDGPHIRKASAKSDNKPSDKTDASNAADSKTAPKADQQAQTQNNAASDDDSAEENAAAANAQPGNAAPATDQDSKKSDQKDAAAKSDAADDANQIDAAAAAAPQAPPADASAQAQQLVTPPAAASQPAAPPANGSNVGSNSNNVGSIGNSAGAKNARATAQATQAARTLPQPSNDDSSDEASVQPQTPVNAAQASLKSAAHDNSKVQTASADAVKNDAPQQQPDAPQAAPATPPAPANTNIANANLGGMTAAPGAIAGGTAAPAAANANLATNVHVAPQGAAPNVNGLAVEIAAKSQSGSKEFQIRLDPPELGHVEVRLSIDATGKTEAYVTADQPQTLHLLQKDSTTLTSALRNAGLDVSQDGLNFSLKGQDRNSGDNSNGAQTRTPSLSLAATKTIDAAQSANAYLSSAGDARLDIHV